MKNIFDNIDAMQMHMQPVNINGLRGRMLKIPATKPKKQDREILMIYGHHASLERVYGLAEDIAQYGNVTVPDLPGFGGMDSFYTIGYKPTLDNLADYLATFVKLRYRGKKLTIMGMSLGFVIATRMLQRYPELVKKVELLISLVGFARHDDFVMSGPKKRSFKLLTNIFKRRLAAAGFYNIALHPTAIRLFYGRTSNAKTKLQHLEKKEQRQMMEFEVILWRDNDVRTYMETSLIMLTLDNCQIQIKLPVHHISVDDDQFFDNNTVEQHMRIIYTDFTNHTAILPNHAPSIIADKSASEPFVSKSIRKLLSSIGPAKASKQ
jgi:pimeloyl-ACP methyl ester carboxylesterase